ncbi:phosphatase PAP2 family protein [Chitinibacter sp. FCG-7]|uniref:Phosphatase PAP2 family protein n=1 Tax=Chitinibacter mangrovi TaxID=3153927 RepID=A0AAU7F4G5_9NEIS
MRRLSPAFYLGHLLFPALLAALLLWVYPQQWDLALISPYYDGVQHQFALRNNFFLNAVMHTGLKSALWFIPLSLLALLLCARFGGPFFASSLLPYRRRMIWILLGLALSALVVQILKRNSIHACPWDLNLFGGQAPLLPLFADLPIGQSPGRCLPGGHASGGFSLLAFYFALRDEQPRWALRSLVLALGLGIVMGWGQMMRGAHFLSHNLWTLWWVWLVLLLLYLLYPPIPRQKTAETPC